jgi:hypothetical protein
VARAPAQSELEGDMTRQNLLARLVATPFALFASGGRPAAAQLHAETAVPLGAGAYEVGPSGEVRVTGLGQSRIENCTITPASSQAITIG